MHNGYWEGPSPRSWTRNDHSYHDRHTRQRIGSCTYFIVMKSVVLFQDLGVRDRIILVGLADAVVGATSLRLHQERKLVQQTHCFNQ